MTNKTSVDSKNPKAKSVSGFFSQEKAYIRVYALKESKQLKQNVIHLIVYLTLSTLGKIFSRRYFVIYFLFSPENWIWQLMQIVSIGDNLHEMSDHILWKNKKNINHLSSAKIAQRVVKVTADV